MNRLAPLRSPVALLTSCALLFAALAAVLALSTQAHAYTTIGSLTLTPSSGKIDDPLMATGAATDGPCPEGSLTSTLGIVLPGDTGAVNLAKLPSGPSTTAAFSGDLARMTPAVAHRTLGQRLLAAIPEGPFDGVYAVGLSCGVNAADAPAFTALVRVQGDSWSVLEQQATGITVTSDPVLPEPGKPYTLTAAVAPAEAAGQVTFASKATEAAEPVELGRKDVADGKAEITLTAPPAAGIVYFHVTFAPTDPQAYAPSEKAGSVPIAGATPTTPPPTSPGPGDSEDLEVTDEEGNPLEADPVLAPGDSVKITARGYPAAAVVKVDLDGGTTLDDAAADAQGTVKDYAFTVPDAIEDGAHTLTLAQEGTEGHSVAFPFSTGDDPTGDPTDPTGTPSGTGSPSETPGSAAGTGSGGSDGGAAGAGSDSGGSGSGTGSGALASTGARIGAAALGALALVAVGGALMIHVRRRGLLRFQAARH